ncbi:unnamed protein product [Paramecium octaurelia]|uniref:RING-type domain-containing protein n=1 Tax=Paramecium octaurelia TaxID=43137 RepID=A0A8S1VZC5_PAROT|nr:unnamed protein product [Paramecium octaurelia]
MHTQQDKIIIYVEYNNESNSQYEVCRAEKIKKFLCEKYKLTEKEIAVKIDSKICDSSDSFDKYIKDDQPLKVLIFDINILIDDYQEQQKIKQSQITDIQTSIENKCTQIFKTERSIQCDLNDSNSEGTVRKSFISIQQSSQLFSQIIQQNFKCIYCQQNIDSSLINTPCQHFFHNECFDQFIYNTLQLSSTTIQCLCNEKFKVQILQVLGEEKFRTYKEILLKNQLFYIQKKCENQIGRCIDNQDCKFWFFKQPNSQIQQEISCYQCSTPQNQDFQHAKSLLPKEQIIIASHNAEQREEDTKLRPFVTKNLIQDQGNQLKQVDEGHSYQNRKTKSEIVEIRKIRKQIGNDSINFNKNKIQQNNVEQQIQDQNQIQTEQVVENQ